MIPFSDADVQRRAFPVVNVTLIAINALVFLYELSLGGGGLLWGGGGGLDITVFFLKWGFIPDELSRGVSCTHLVLGGDPCPRLPLEFLASPESNLKAVEFTNGLVLVNIHSMIPTWATIFSSMFIHGGLVHFAGNMMFLWVFGDNIESRLGHVKYLLFYVGTGAVATLSHFAVDPNSQAPLVGASGAIAGIMGAYLLLYPFNRIRALVIFFFITVIELQFLAFLGFFFLYQVINGLGLLGLAAGVNVAHMAHVGGFVAGVALIAAYKLVIREPVWPSRHRRNPWDYWHRAGRGPD